jgi:ribonuclease P protein component
VSTCRFGVEYRLRSGGDYAAVFSQRRVIRGEWFWLHFRPGSEACIRLGLLVAKKHARRAVHRNLIKRIARETFRQVRSGMPAADVVLRLARPLGGAAVDGELRRTWASEIASLMGRLPR